MLLDDVSRASVSCVTSYDHQMAVITHRNTWRHILLPPVTAQSKQPQKELPQMFPLAFPRFLFYEVGGGSGRIGYKN